MVPRQPSTLQRNPDKQYGPLGPWELQFLGAFVLPG